jgi:methylase of polypeptide subunit release factors
MPYSYNLFKEEVKQNILNSFQNDIKILDVGAGCGTYSNFLKDNFPNMDRR